MDADAARRRILAEIRRVPAGRVAAYGEIARRAGLPGRARLVAKILASHDEDDLPWHRVLRADGRIAFPPRSAGRREQVARLKAEGVKLRAGRVVLEKRIEDDLDALLWKPG
jgi:methylated-DNA-protein-cysteine methyltransferase related protein